MLARSVAIVTFGRGICAALMLAALAAPAKAEEEPAKQPVEALSATLPEKVRSALPSIEEGGPRLLALRGYLASARSIEKRWSWTAAEIETCTGSPEHAAALADIEKVRDAFEAANEGFTLEVNTRVRSLDEQIASWNRNASVERAAAALMDDFEEWRDATPDADAEDLRVFLAAWRPASSVSLATPGLSPHGRARAFDFQIRKGAEIVAGADTGAVTGVWEKDGWAAKLKAAVEKSEAPFDGPLEKPKEPWHYDYDPPPLPPAQKEAESAQAEPAKPSTDAKPAESPPLPEAKPADLTPPPERMPEEPAPVPEAKPDERPPVPEAKSANAPPMADTKPAEPPPIPEAKPADLPPPAQPLPPLPKPRPEP